MFKFISSLFFGSKQKRDVKKLWPLVVAINESFEDCAKECGLTNRLPEQGKSYPPMTDAEKSRVDAFAKPKSEELKTRAREKGESLDDLLVEAFALMKLACWRKLGEAWTAGGNDIVWDMVPFDVQLMGGIALHRGNIAEMATGEGKTLVAILPMYLNALSGKGVHLVTVNDYLSKRDSEWMTPVFEYLGLTVGCIDKSEPHTAERRAAYACDITYGTNNEFGFDYLRENMAHEKDQLVQGDLNYAIVDEVDSILIDEARTPLIISGPVDRSTHMYDKLVPYVRDLVNKQVYLVNRLAGEAEKALGENEEDYEAGIRLVQCQKGAPKIKRFTRLRNVPSYQRLSERVELEFMRDKRVAELEAELYFVVDERGFSVTLTDKGRETMSPENPRYWILPDIVEETSEVEGATEVTEVDRRRLEAMELMPDEEVKRLKIKGCGVLTDEEKVELMRAVSCPGMDDPSRQAVIDKVRGASHKVLDLAVKAIDAAGAVNPHERKRLLDLAYWKDRESLIERLRRAAAIPDAERIPLLRRLLSPAEGIAKLDGDPVADAENTLARLQDTLVTGEPLVLDTEFQERKLRRTDLPEDIQLEVIRALRWSHFDTEEMREQLERLVERLDKRVAFLKKKIDDSLILPPPPPPPGENQEAPPPPPPPEKQAEEQVKACDAYTAQESEEILKILRRPKGGEFEERLEQIRPIQARAKARLDAMAASLAPAMDINDADRAALRDAAPDPLDEELAVLQILQSEVFEEKERAEFIRALWEPNLLPDERRARMERVRESARQRAKNVYQAVVDATVIRENDRETFGSVESRDLYDVEMTHRKILLCPALVTEERDRLLRLHWAPATQDEKRQARIESAMKDIHSRLATDTKLAREWFSGAQSSKPNIPEPPAILQLAPFNPKARMTADAYLADARKAVERLDTYPAILDALFTLTEEDRKTLPGLIEPLPDNRLREAKIKLCPGLNDEERLDILRAVHCPGLDDEVRAILIRRAKDKALARLTDPEEREAVESCTVLTDEDRRVLPTMDMPVWIEELQERKIRQCPYLSEEEAGAMIKAIWMPEFPDDKRKAVIHQAKELAKNRRRENFDKKAEELHNISQLLVAYMLKEKDVDYVVEENKVIIVDEFTGRKMPGRRWSDGLHQAVEAKEGVVIERETQTLATVTIQNYFRMYKKLAGMTGTAETEAGEFAHTYKMDVIVVPTNRAIQRADLDDVIYQTKREKYAAAIEEIARLHEMKLPVLVGTTSVEVSETLSRMLRRAGISHNVLNAKNHLREAEIVREAGREGTVTIATNMAGRGTDIKLGPGVRDPRTYTDENGKQQEWPGGLQILGTERHEARRIDRQLRGRAGRQGDPGSTRFFVSLEDDLMRLFGSDRLSKIMTKLGMKEGEPIIHPWVSKAISRAQKKVEEINFERRKKTLEYDNVMNKQREAIYGLRREFLTADDTGDALLSVMAEGIAGEFAAKFGDTEKENAKNWDLPGFFDWVQRTVPYAEFSELRSLNYENFDALLESTMAKVAEGYEAKREMLNPEVTTSIGRYIAVRTIDENWQDHLLAIDDLREGIHLRSYAQRDPLVEYTHDATNLFNDMMATVQKQIFERFFRVQLVSDNAPQSRVTRMQYRKDEVSTASSTQTQQAGAPQEPEGPKYQTVRRDQPKVSPNDPCPCGSGKKYKKCCGSAQMRQSRRSAADAEARALAQTKGEPPPE